MAVTVRVPTVLRDLTDGEDEIEGSGATVREVLVELGERHPQLLERITDDGEVNEFLNVFVNGENIRMGDELDTTVEDGDTIRIMPSIAGGRCCAW